MSDDNAIRSVVLVIAPSEDGDEYAIFSDIDKATDWADARPESCVIAYPMMVDEPDYGSQQAS